MGIAISTAPIRLAPHPEKWNFWIIPAQSANHQIRRIVAEFSIWTWLQFAESIKISQLQPNSEPIAAEYWGRTRLQSVDLDELSRLQPSSDVEFGGLQWFDNFIGRWRVLVKGLFGNSLQFSLSDEELSKSGQWK